MKKVKPLRSKALRRTVRWEGAPSGEAVARVMAFGSWTPSWVACLNHESNWSMGSARRSSRRRPLAEYSFLNSDRSMII